MIRFSELSGMDELSAVENKKNETPLFDTALSVDESCSFWNDFFDEPNRVSILDILNHSESEFTFDVDISDMKELLNKFDDNEWNHYSDIDKMDIINEFVERVSEKLQLKDVPVVEFFRDDPENCGVYNAATNTISVNELELGQPKELLRTISHELRHAYQKEHAENPSSQTDLLYRINFDNYISPVFTEDGDCMLFTDYQDQLIEAEARAFAQLFVGEESAA